MFSSKETRQFVCIDADWASGANEHAESRYLPITNINPIHTVYEKHERGTVEHGVPQWRGYAVAKTKNRRSTDVPNRTANFRNRHIAADLFKASAGGMDICCMAVAEGEIILLQIGRPADRITRPTLLATTRFMIWRAGSACVIGDCGTAHFSLFHILWLVKTRGVSAWRKWSQSRTHTTNFHGIQK